MSAYDDINDGESTNYQALDSKRTDAASVTSYSSQISGTDNESIRNSSKNSGKQSSKPKSLQNYRRESAVSESSTYRGGTALSGRNAVEIEVQTEWSWVRDMVLLEKIRKCEILIDEEDEAEAETYYSDESVVLDETDVTVSAATTANTPLLDSVGPPKILQYVPETRQDAVSPLNQDEEDDEVREINTYMKNFNVQIKGHSTCEFCGQQTKAWPSIKEQETRFPEELYCCTDYREYVDALVEMQTTKNDQPGKLININPHPKTKNRKERQLAKQRAEARAEEKMKEKEERKRQEKLQQEQQDRGFQSQLTEPHTDGYTERSYSTNADHFKSVRSSVTNLTKRTSREKEPGSTKNNMNKTTTLKKLARAKSRTSTTSSSSDGVLDLRANTPILARQVRSINYQLSNLQYLNDGWTVRQPSPLLFDDVSDSDEEPDILVPATISSATIKMTEKPLFMKYYKNGNLCMILFPDNTGNVYYENGRLAMTISLVARGMHIFTLFSDELMQDVIAVFDPYGNVSCNFPNGKLRIQMGPLGGAEFELDLPSEVHRRKRWLWWDSTKHVHAPPFQPINFTLNSVFGVKIHDQQKIYLSFTSEGHQYNFRVGSKLQVAKPQAIPSGFKLDSDLQYLSKSKRKIEQVIKSINNHIAKTTIQSVKLPRILSESQNLFSDSKLRLTNRSTHLSSKLLGMDSESRMKMLTSRSITDKISSKSSSKFLIVP